MFNISRFHIFLNMATLRIRRYTTEDYPYICALDAPLFPGMGGPVLFRHIEELFPALFLVAEIADTHEIVGFILGGIHLDEPEVGKLIRIGVAPGFQRKDCGTRLTTELLRLLKERGVKLVHLTVAETNEPAVRFYTKLGFTKRLRAEKYFYPGIPRLVLEIEV